MQPTRRLGPMPVWGLQPSGGAAAAGPARPPIQPRPAPAAQLPCCAARPGVCLYRCLYVFICVYIAARPGASRVHAQPGPGGRRSGQGRGRPGPARLDGRTGPARPRLDSVLRPRCGPPPTRMRFAGHSSHRPSQRISSSASRSNAGGTWSGMAVASLKMPPRRRGLMNWIRGITDDLDPSQY